MAGIYIHIPFCRQKCGYCNFYSVTVETHGRASLQTYVNALISEIELRKNECPEPIETIYFGGGTPSLLNITDVVKIFVTLQKSFVFAENMEITFEGNPESLTKGYLENLRKYTPVNRLSIGVQSFFEDDLKYLNRKHSPKQALEAIENAQKVGFERLSMDLIYGIPTLTDEKWNENLQMFFSLDISHLSAYALTVEPNTILDKQIRNHKTKSPNEEQIEQQYLILREQLKNHNFEAYETSNFCKNKQYSKHNSNYWNLSKYYGFGTSAHRFSGTVRSWNVADVNAYITSVKTGILPSESEFLTQEMQYNEYVMTAIRTQWGISQDFIKTNFDEQFFLHFQNHIAQIPNDWLFFENDCFITTEKGALFSDAIAEKLFI
ncbi:MAG: radical SAM family heme chaperone HemW [Bacteroidales bacterium]|jgi:oxygen-independent coproporphyrinogen-3 oxidase|nr:radical SAM family heme chaperone HemW [Bacteroidales bacterium]